MTLFRKYRVESIRRPDWDYSSPGFYFVTICTYQKRWYFGIVKNAEVKLSRIGKCADKQWRETPSHYKNVELDEFIVMPSHLHGIIKITGPWEPKLSRNNVRKTLSDVSPKSGSLSHVIRCYKGGVTYWCKERALTFSWQDGFDDRIILGSKSLEAIRQYIRDNPRNWEKDSENTKIKK